MHVPDGFLDVPTSLATGAIAVGGVGLALRKARDEIAVTGPALPGLTAAFIFSVQMVNFPVGAGTSGHLLGGALAAALVGPWTAILVMTVVFVVQALLFADGGLTALGTNVLVMGLVTVLVGYGVLRLVVRALPRRPSSVIPAAALGALVSVPAAAAAFTVLYALGGAVDIPLPTLAVTMIGWHALIGVGEAVITSAILGAVVPTRPDLVYAARGLRPDLILLDADGRSGTVAAAGARNADTHTASAATPWGTTSPGPGSPRSGRSLRGFLAGSGLVTLIIAGAVSLLASAHPDGLEFVGEQLGFGGAARDSAVASSPLAGYALSGLPDGLATSAAGIIGVVVTVLLGAAVAWVASRRTASARLASVSHEPMSDKPWSDKPGSDKAMSDSPGSKKPMSDKPLSDEPMSDKPLSDEPMSDRPASAGTR